MPATFSASYTPIAAAGTPAQIRHVARLMATQFSMAGFGPDCARATRTQAAVFNKVTNKLCNKSTSCNSRHLTFCTPEYHTMQSIIIEN